MSARVINLRDRRGAQHERLPPTKHKSPLGGGPLANQGTGKTKPKSGRRVAQGMKIDRNPSQSPPRWKAPRGADAAVLLTELLGKRRRP
jgi:hypothetical protein